ncbi:MAG: hypothetical protein Q8O57_00060, partial [Kiritimatiellota bacterium]|nr:hypothetical protein [Kiritimatiellota bacterium]
MSIRTTVLSIVIALLFGSVAARAESPQIFFISPGNEAATLLLLGSGLDPAGTNEFIYWCPEPLIDFARGTDWHQGAHADAVKEADALFLSYMGRSPALPLEVPAKSEKYPSNPARRKAEPVAERGF